MENLTQPWWRKMSLWKRQPGQKPGLKRCCILCRITKKYEEYTNGNELLTIQEAFDAVNTRTISLLTTDVKSRNLISVCRETMEEALKSLKTKTRILARWSRVMWDLLLTSEQEAKKLSGNVSTSKTLCLQTEYMGTWRTQVMVHRVPIDIKEDRLGGLFCPGGDKCDQEGRFRYWWHGIGDYVDT